MSDGFKWSKIFLNLDPKNEQNQQCTEQQTKQSNNNKNNNNKKSQAGYYIGQMR